MPLPSLGVISGNQNFKGKEPAATKPQAARAARVLAPIWLQRAGRGTPAAAATSPHGAKPPGTALC